MAGQREENVQRAVADLRTAVNGLGVEAKATIRPAEQALIAALADAGYTLRDGIEIARAA
jgi:hypothetical protein